METKKFPLAVVLGLITHTVLTEDGSKRMTELVEFMTGERLPGDPSEAAKHQARCANDILRHHPYLGKVKTPPADALAMKEWLHKQTEVYGREIEIAPFVLQGGRPEQWCSLCCNTGRALSLDPGSSPKSPFIVSSECPACGGQSAQWIIPQEIRLGIRNNLLWNRFDLDTDNIREFDSKQPFVPGTVRMFEEPVATEGGSFQMDESEAGGVLALLLQALQSDGAHHKQYFLEQLGKKLGLLPPGAERVWEPGIAP